MAEHELTPAPDDAFALMASVTLQAHTVTGAQRVDVWVGQSGDYKTHAVNLDIGYIERGNFKNTNIDLAPEDAERLGVLLQYAAKLAKKLEAGTDG
jgi:hypothetical protein